MAWEETRARLLTLAELADHDGDPQSAADIRAALERDAAMTQMMQRIAEDVLPDPVRYADLTPEVVRDAFIKYHMKAGAEVVALRQREAALVARAALKDPSPGGPAPTGGTLDGVTGVSPESPVCSRCGYRRENVRLAALAAARGE